MVCVADTQLHFLLVSGDLMLQEMLGIIGRELLVDTRNCRPPEAKLCLLP